MITYGTEPTETSDFPVIPNSSTTSNAVCYSLAEPVRLLQQRTVSEYFAGIGLMRMGLEQAGWRVRYANDIAPDKQAMYNTQFPGSEKEFILEDIHQLQPQTVPATALATASFPCTDLSLAGSRTGLGGKHSSAFWGFVRILEQKHDRRPPFVLLENVVGFLTSKAGLDFGEALKALNRLGYLVDAFIIDASHFVPQSRVRLFVVGIQRQCLPHLNFRESQGLLESALRPKALADFILTHPEIGWALRDLPALPTRQATLSEVLEDLPSDAQEWWSPKRRDYLLGQMSKRHAEQLERMRQARAWSYGTVFRRVRKGRSMGELRTDGLAGCLRTPKGGSARQILVKAGFGEVHVRLLTPRECARLMGAGNFRIELGANQALFGFGDAVCVPVVRWIAENYLTPLRDEILAEWNEASVSLPVEQRVGAEV